MPRRRSNDKQFIDLTQSIDFDKFKVGVRSSFADFPDPRIPARCEYPAWYLFLIILSGYIAGCDTLADIAHFAELRGNWFADLIGTNKTSPSYDTLWWFLVRVKPEAFKEMMRRWLGSVPLDLRNQLLVIDGKRLRGVSNSEHVTHIVELFAAERCLTIAQEKVPNKKDERCALPALLDTIEVKGAIVSMDALYAHVDDIEQVLKKGADYIVGIKGNQGNLEAEALNFFEQAKAVEYDGVQVTRLEIHEKDHGRIESRHICVTNDLEWLPQQMKWHMQSLIEIRSERVIGEKVERAIRYYASSRRANAKDFLNWIRGHWSIENSLHHVMDVVFDEDASLCDTGHSAENMSLIRRISANIIRIFDPGRGVADAKRCATYEPNYLMGLLAKVFVK